MIYIIDHQDSFTWNVVHQFAKFDQVICSNYYEINNELLNKSDVLVFCEQIHNDFPELKLCGLMMIPPLHGEPSDWFQRLHDIALKGREQGLPLHELSMGMSGDLQHAIAAGSTMIRVGTALFRGL